MKPYCSLYILLIIMPILSQGQDTLGYYKSKPTLIQNAEELTKSLADNNPKDIAKSYEDLANNLIEKGDYKRAETYLTSALTIYKDLKNKRKVTKLTRQLAQVQENQEKFTEAISNYLKASKEADASSSSQMNINDANRVSQRADPVAQMDFIDANIQIAQEETNVDEEIDLYTQKAANHLIVNDKEDALINYEKAIELAADKPEKALKLKRQVATIYESNNELDKAISLTQSAIAEALKQNDIATALNQKLQLANLHAKNNNENKALALYNELYKQAHSQGKIHLAKEVTLAQAALINAMGETKNSFSIYKRFLADFDSLIKKDSSLIDTKLFATTEEKIKQLENERQLKDRLLEKSNTLNTVLILSIALMFILFTLVVRSFFSIKIKNKRIALQSLRREMNPHFIFNSLNSVNQYIAQNNELEANKYLTSYSNLMRSMMETSNKDFISLSEEIEQLKKYLNLEHLRFQDKFDYTIKIDPNLDLDAVKIPTMLIQPQLENAIWHGLRYKETKGNLKLEFKKINSTIKVTVIDNGIGLEKSNALKTGNQKLHVSRGLNNVKERIQLLNALHKKNIQFDIKNQHQKAGTRVKLTFNQ